MIMHKNPIWLIFLASVGILVMWFSGALLYKLYNYSVLTASTQTVELQWSVKEISDESYILEARYSYVVKGEKKRGAASLYDMPYWNAWAAEKAIAEFSSKPWKVWYSPSNSDYSTLQKKFPLKECISTGVLWLLFIYFTWLGFYVARYHT